MNQAMQTKLQGVKRKDVAEDTAALREFQKTLTEGVDWWKEGVSTYWTHEAAAKFHLTPPVEDSGERVLTLRALKPARNNRFILCESPDEAGMTVPVLILPRTRSEKLKGKKINVVRRDGQFHQVR